MNEEELRAAGFSEEEIREYLARQAPGAVQQMSGAAADQSRGTTRERVEPNASPLNLGPLGVAGGLGYGGYRAVRSTFPSNVARRRTARAVEQSGGVERLMRALDEYDRSGRGGIVTLGDLSIPLGEQGADFTATRNEAARAKLLDLHTQRQRGVPGRLLGDVRELAPGGYSSATLQSDLIDRSRADFAASPLGYEGLRAANPTIPVELLPEMQEFVLDPKLGELWSEAAAAAEIGPMPAADPTSFESMQNLKFRLDDATSAAFKKGHGNLGSRLGAARDRLVDVMRRAVPGYAEVDAQYRRFIQQGEALESGLAAWKDNATQLPDLERQLAGLSPDELKAFRQGVVSGYVRDIENARTNRNLANQLLARSAVTERKLEMIFGSPAAFQEAVRRFEQEGMMSRMGGYIGGPATARRLVAPGSDAAESAAEVAARAPTGGMVSRTTDKILDAYQGSVAREMAPWFTAQGSDELRRLLRMIPR